MCDPMLPRSFRSPSVKQSLRHVLHITPGLQQLHWLPVRHRVTYKLCLRAFRCLHGTAPPYLTELLHPHTRDQWLQPAAHFQLTLCWPKEPTTKGGCTCRGGGGLAGGGYLGQLPPPSSKECYATSKRLCLFCGLVVIALKTQQLMYSSSRPLQWAVMRLLWLQRPWWQAPTLSCGN